MAGAASPLPQSFGKYTLVDRIAAGGMAEVFRAKLFGVAGFEKTIAVKRILPHFASDDGFVRMFVREANVAVKLSHANVVQVFELGRVGDDYYIALEFVEGKDLKTLVRKAAERGGTLPPDLAAFIAQKMCAGLHHAHTATDDTGAPLGIVHRDVSPHNVLVSWTGEIKVADFGIARLASAARVTRTGTIKGKLAYMSPEQSEGDPDLDARSDVFAVGICLFEMLTGTRPFEGETDREILKKIREAPTPLPGEFVPCPKELEAIVEKSLRKRREDRFPDAASMGRALAAFLQKSARIVDEESVAEMMRVLAGPRPVAPTPIARGGGTPVLPAGALGDAGALAGPATPVAGEAATRTPPTPRAGSEPTASRAIDTRAGTRAGGAGGPDGAAVAPSMEVFAAATRGGDGGALAREATVLRAAPARAGDRSEVATTPSVAQGTLTRDAPGPEPARRRRGGLFLGGAALVAVAAGAFAIGRMQSRARHGASATPVATSSVVTEATIASPAQPAASPGAAPVPATGTLRIEGAPPGAKVLVDRNPAGSAGEEITGLALGTHAVLVTAEGYRAASTSITLSAAAPTATPHVTLSRARGEIRVGHGTDNVCRVSIPGVTRRGQELAARFEGVAVGRYLATIDCGSKHFEKAVVVGDGRITRVIIPPRIDDLAAVRAFTPD